MLPNTCIGVKFGLNKIFDGVNDDNTQNRILNAIYLLSIDLKDEGLVDSGTVISDFIGFLGFSLETGSLVEDGSDVFGDRLLQLNIILDAFFLLEYPKNIKLVDIIKSNLSGLVKSNFFLLRHILCELYAHSRESCYDFLNEGIFHENVSSENTHSFLSKLHVDVIEKEKLVLDVNGDELKPANNIFNSTKAKVGVPSFLDFEHGSHDSKRINFFYIEDESCGEMNSILNCVRFSMYLRGDILENLLQLVKKFQNVHKCNPVSILIFRLILNRSWDCIEDCFGTLIQLINIGNHDEILLLLFECSLLMKDEELFDVFSLYYYLGIKTDFADILRSLKRTIQLKTDKRSLHWNKLSSWISVDNRDLSYIEKSLLKQDFSNNHEMIKFLLDYFKNEVSLNLKKYNSLLDIIEMDKMDKESMNKVYELTRNLIEITPFTQRGVVLDILKKLFSLSEEICYNISIPDLNNLYMMNYMINDFLIEYLGLEEGVEENLGSICDFNDICFALLGYCKYFSSIRDTKENRQELINSTLREVWVRFLIVLINRRGDSVFICELFKTLCVVNVRQQLALFWFVTTHSIGEVTNKISAFCSQRRRISSIQCGMRCIEIELDARLEQITQILKLDIDYESACILLFILRATQNNRDLEKLSKIFDAVRTEKKSQIFQNLTRIVNNVNFENKEKTAELSNLGLYIRELLHRNMLKNSCI